MPTKKTADLRPGDVLVKRTLEAVCLARKFQLLVKRAERMGFAVVVDADAIAIRIVNKATSDSGEDLRTLGEVVKVHNACGGGGPMASGTACNDGNYAR